MFGVNKITLSNPLDAADCDGFDQSLRQIYGACYFALLDFSHHVHARNYLAKGRKALPVRIAFAAKI